MNPHHITSRLLQAPVRRAYPSAGRVGHAWGFTVLEVLVALGIFAVGFAAVAAIFPAAAILQRQTMDEMTGQGLEKSVQALLSGRPFTTASLNTLQPNDSHLSAVHSNASPAWTSDDLTFPSTSALGVRRFSAYLMVRRQVVTIPPPNTPAGQWQVFAFILRKVNLLDVNPPTPISIGVSGVTSPSYQGTFNLSSSLPNDYSIRIGDAIIDSHGTRHIVKSVTTDSVTVTGAILDDPVFGFPNAIWYVPAPSADRVSPTLRIIGPITNAVKD